MSLCTHTYKQVVDSESPDSAQCFCVQIFSHGRQLLRNMLVFVSVITCNSRDSFVVSPQGLTSHLDHCQPFRLVQSTLIFFKREKRGNPREIRASQSVQLSVCFISHRYWVCVVYLELSRLIVVEVGPRRQKVEEHLQQLHVLPRHIWDLKDWTHPAESEGVRGGKNES